MALAQPMLSHWIHRPGGRPDINAEKERYPMKEQIRDIVVVVVALGLCAFLVVLGAA